MKYRTDSEKVQKFLNDHGYTYNSLAKAMQIPPRNLQLKLLEKESTPVFYIKVASILGVSINDLFYVIFPDAMNQNFKK